VAKARYRGQNWAVFGGGQAQCRLRQAPVGGGPSAYVPAKTTIGLAGWAMSQGVGRGRQRPLIGGTGQPNKPINANWQAAFLLGLAGPAEFTNSQFVVARLANRVIGGALGCCRRSWKRERAGFGVSGRTGSPLRRWGNRRSSELHFGATVRPGWLGRGEKAQRRLVGRQKLTIGAKIGYQLPAGRRSAG